MHSREKKKITIIVDGRNFMVFHSVISDNMRHRIHELRLHMRALWMMLPLNT